VAPARRVLIIAYYFPPLGGAGVQRTLKFVKYLPQFGWRATVVSTSSRLYPSRDPALTREIPAETRVVRAPALPIARYVAILLHKLGLMRLKAYVSWPDGGFGWVPGAFLATWREVRRTRPDVIFSTSAPYGGHLVALAIHRLTGIPWIADFRDEWAADDHDADRPRALARLNGHVEHAIRRHAAQTVVVADYFRLAGDGPRVTITNGVDPADIPEGDGAPPDDRFRLTYVGTVYGTIDLAPVLAALARLIAAGHIAPEQVELRIVGGIWLPEFTVPDGVPLTQTGYLNHDEAIAEMRRATALLLFRPALSLAPSGKIFEYLAAERPVLCVTRPENLASQLVSEWDAGAVAHPSDDGAIEEALLSLYQRWRTGDLAAPHGTRARVLARFSRRELTRQLAEVLDAAADQ
jgi:glycosyltransferase involved in cell wall biosynthesis